MQMDEFCKRILIIDEEGFSRVCSAILEFEGFQVESLEKIGNISEKLTNDQYGLAIASVPYGDYVIEEIWKRNIPLIILCDQINKDVMNMLEYVDKSYCMIKPINYIKFRTLVRNIMNDNMKYSGGYKIVY